MREFKISSRSMKLSGYVRVDYRNFIEKSSPVFHKFIGQHVNKLLYWMEHHGDVSVKEITTHPEFAFMRTVANA